MKVKAFLCACATLSLWDIIDSLILSDIVWDFFKGSAYYVHIEAEVCLKEAIWFWVSEISSSVDWDRGQKVIIRRHYTHFKTMKSTSNIVPSWLITTMSDTMIHPPYLQKHHLLTEDCRELQVKHPIMKLIYFWGVLNIIHSTHKKQVLVTGIVDVAWVDFTVHPFALNLWKNKDIQCQRCKANWMQSIVPVSCP